MADRYPPQPAVDWAASLVGAKVVSYQGLRHGSNPWMLRFDDDTEAVLRLAPPAAHSRQRTEVAAMRLARRHGIPVPELLGANIDGHCAVLISAVTGHSTIPVTPAPARLRALGAAAAALHAVTLDPGPDLPQRTRPIESVDFAAMRRESGTTDLLAGAEALIARLPQPRGAVFVHGDLWQGNTLWSGDALAAVIDWDCAGSGHPGVDLGSLRCDAAIAYGPETAHWNDALLVDRARPRRDGRVRQLRAHRKASRCQIVGELPNRLRRPSQRALRITSRLRLDETIQRVYQTGLNIFHSFPPRPRRTHPR